MPEVRYSKQREAVKKYLQSTTSHPTAETVYDHVKEEFPNISLGTVYRNLNFLVQHGDAMYVNVGDGFEHFDGNPKPHNHFFCRECGKVYDLKMDPIDHVNKLANVDFPGKIEGHMIYFYGKCEKCLQK